MNRNIMKAEIKANASLIRTLQRELHKQEQHLVWVGTHPNEIKPGDRYFTVEAIANLMIRIRKESQIQRHRLLAYGYLRGRTYRQMEPKTEENNRPSVKAVSDLIGDPKETDFIRLWFEIGTVPRHHVRAATDQAVAVEKLVDDARRASAHLNAARNMVDNCKTRIDRLRWDLKSAESDLPKFETNLKDAAGKAELANKALDFGRKQMDEISERKGATV